MRVVEITDVVLESIMDKLKSYDLLLSEHEERYDKELQQDIIECIQFDRGEIDHVIKQIEDVLM